MRPRRRHAIAAAGLMALVGAGGTPATADREGPGVGGSQPPAAVAAAALPLVAIDPGAGGEPASDLDALARWLGEARVVGLGEGSHGTHTLHRLTHRLFAHLASEAGFEVLALEIDQAHAALLDEWVQGERDDLDAILAARWWGSEIFYDEATLDLLRWMRDENRRGERQLRVAGFDLKQPALAAKAVVEALRPIDGTAAATVESLFRRALAPGAFGLFPNVWGFTATLRVPLPPRREAVAVRVELEARGEGMTYGSAGIAATGGELQERASLRPGELTADWRPFRLELEVPSDVPALELTLHHRGDGTIWLTAPRVTVGSERQVVDLAGLRLRSLLMPRLQANDYRHELVRDPGGDGEVLRVAADPVLGESRAAAAQAEAGVRAAVQAAGSRLDARRGAWIVQAARLVRQAVEWRTLGQSNRDVFLADNLLWLANTAFPRSRILALAHISHTERRAGRMGAYLDGPLGASYRTVSMLVGSGVALEFAELATLDVGAPLIPVAIEPAAPGIFEGPIGALRAGDFVLPLADVAATVEGRRWLEGVHPRPAEAPEVVIWVRQVTPMRPASTRR